MEVAECSKLEERALNAWPGIQQAVYDGWLLRFAHGYTRRANSVVSMMFIYRLYAEIAPQG